MSLRREKYLPKGGPDGGDGGRGGSVILVADENINTLLDFRGRRHWFADNGRPGEGSDKTGVSADDLIIRLPPGTLVFNDITDDLLVDINKNNMRHVIAKGGKGGYGNAHFKSATNQTPRHATSGDPGEEFQLRLELKLLADIGLVGMPNAGKSTFIRAISKARPTVAAFPFTTLQPQLGIAELDHQRRLVFADIPGLIKGAAEGAGLGHDFLRHIDRTRAIVHLLDILPIDESDPVENYITIKKELAQYSTELGKKREVIVLNKIDLVYDDEQKELINQITSRLAQYISNENNIVDKPMVMSGATGLGTAEVLNKCWEISQVLTENIIDD